MDTRLDLITIPSHPDFVFVGIATAIVAVMPGIAPMTVPMTTPTNTIEMFSNVKKIENAAVRFSIMAD